MSNNKEPWSLAKLMTWTITLVVVGIPIQIAPLIDLIYDIAVLWCLGVQWHRYFTSDTFSARGLWSEASELGESFVGAGAATGFFNMGVEAHQAGNSSQALGWYLQAAELGYAPAQYNLGLCLIRGDGAEADKEHGLQWIKKAAQQGQEEARRLLEQEREANESAGVLNRRRAAAREMLEVERGAGRADIEAAFRRLMAMFHPDKGGSTYFAKELNEAREVLLDELREQGRY